MDPLIELVDAVGRRHRAESELPERLRRVVPAALSQGMVFYDCRGMLATASGTPRG